MIKPILEKDTCLSLKLITGEELIVRVVDFNDEIIEIKDSRTIAMGQDRQIGLMPTFMLGGDLQRGQVVRSQVAAIGVLGAENEKKYLAEISGIVV